ncbi:MAG: polysaccharide biosynthesis protein [Gammaproteobacteria bacterium]
MKNKRILIIGGTGSLGQALIRRFKDNNELLIFSRDEAKQWTVRNHYPATPGLDFLVGSIRDVARLEEVITRFVPQVIIIAAALKQVDTCELSPFESIQTNIIGVKNVIDVVLRHHRFLSPMLETVLMVSTDKACAPTNVYGMCKAISERLITSASKSFTTPKFCVVRYGNVLESRGSIIPLFKYQAEHAEKFTLTHRDMTRYLMTLDESIDLIVKTIQDGSSGETWIPKLRSMRIMDLVDIFCKKYNKDYAIIGMRPGEKIHEDLISPPESVRTIEKDGHYVVQPSHQPIQEHAPLFSYSSFDDTMSRDELEDYLMTLGIFDKHLQDFQGKSIEEIRTN